jgi:hypothetical protein
METRMSVQMRSPDIHLQGCTPSEPMQLMTQNPPPDTLRYCSGWLLAESCCHHSSDRCR